MRNIPKFAKQVLSICLVLTALLSLSVSGFVAHADSAESTVHSCGSTNPTYTYDWDQNHENEYHYTVCTVEGCTYRVKGDHVNRYEPLPSDSQYYGQNHRAICTLCGNVNLPKHTYPDNWVFVNEIHHAQYCPDCGVRVSYLPHNYSHKNSNPPSPLYTNADIHTYTCADCFDIITGEHQFENGKCKECDGCETHSWGNWARVDDVNHRRSCTGCIATETVAHNWNGGTQSGNQITYTCTTCRATKTETKTQCTHEWGKWVSCPADADHSNPYHKRTCTLCSEAETASHTLTAWALVNNNAEHHKRTCTADGCVYAEEHMGGGNSIMDWTKVDMLNHRGSCSVDGCNIEVISAPHNYSYTANGDTILGTCGLCGNEISCTLMAPLELSYNGTPRKAILSGAYIGNPTIIYDNTTTDAPKNAGDHTATVNIGGATVSITYTITPAKVTPESVTVEDKIYDTKLYATVSVDSVSGIVAGDDVIVKANAYFDSPDIGTDKDVSVSFSLIGDDAANYELTTKKKTVKGNILPIPIEILDVKIADKHYDGTTDATITEIVVADSFDHIHVTINANAEFADANSGQNKDVKVSFTLEGAEKSLCKLNITEGTFKGNILTKSGAEVLAPVAGLTPDTVKKSDKETVQSVLDEFDLLLKDEGLTDAQKKDLTDSRKVAQALMDVINLEYKLTGGNNSVWRKDSKKDLTFTANGGYGRFTTNGSVVKVDGTAIEAKHFTAKEGSTVVTLKSSYLQTLKLGKHTVSIVYADGSADGSFTVEKASPVPETGDDANPMVYAAALTASLLGLAAVLLRRKLFDR